MPGVLFFSTFMSMLYYLGIMQRIVIFIGRCLSYTLGSTAAESMNAAGNMFVSMTESNLMISPFIPTMTAAELHSIMVAGFGSIAGSVLGPYIRFGIPADHLLSATVMSAPATLAVTRICYPEVEVPKVTIEDIENMERIREGSIIDAAIQGAMLSFKIISCILVNLIAFLSVLRFINATLTWFGDRVGLEDVSFEMLCSYFLYPVAVFMGTEWSDCRRMAELVGIKTFTNEFIAYEKLAELIKNRQAYEKYLRENGPGSIHFVGEDIILGDFTNSSRLIAGIISQRSEVIATYALCGFSNIGSMGIVLGSLSAMAPNRQTILSKLVFRAMVAGNVACFVTACIAGLFFHNFEKDET
ncbi:solute carrier family 28 member 3-like [Physella acuta]|uniref:solute carrier family 28 member 3-like n=1 Tax=Physella acuta TaxID=109671 RepID=UPI0027DADA03|nr:solute carrier family 28 member 3-like [Physella acuta]